MAIGKNLLGNILNRHKLPPGPKGDLVLGVIRPMQADPLGFLTQSAKDFPGICHLRFAHISAFLINDPALIAHVAHANKDNYVKSPLYGVARDITGDGLFTSEGNKWRKHRAMAEPAFSAPRISEMLPKISDVCKTFAENMGAGAAVGVSLVVTQIMMQLAQEITVPLLFGTHVGTESIGEAWNTINSEILSRWWGLAKVTALLPTKRNMAYRAAKETLDKFVYDIIRERRANPTGEGMISTFIQGLDSAYGKDQSDTNIRDEALTFLISSYESTAMALSWTLYLLGTHGDVKQNVFSELDAAIGLDFSSTSLLRQLPYLKAVIDESLRLYPPVWGLSRSALKEDVIDGYTIPADSVVIISPYVVHRNQEFWSNPEKFDPKRFQDRPDPAPLSYIPFGFGERVCIGAQLATYELMIAIATLLRQFDFNLLDVDKVKKEALVTIRPSDELKIRFKER